MIYNIFATLLFEEYLDATATPGKVHSKHLQHCSSNCIAYDFGSGGPSTGSLHFVCQVTAVL